MSSTTDDRVTGVGADHESLPYENVTFPSSDGVPLDGVHDDVLTAPEDLQTIHDNIPISDKALAWVRGTTRRWDGYLEFQRRPEPMLDRFDRHWSQR